MCVTPSGPLKSQSLGTTHIYLTPRLASSTRAQQGKVHPWQSIVAKFALFTLLSSILIKWSYAFWCAWVAQPGSESPGRA